MATKAPKLTETQQQIIDAMVNGARLQQHWMSNRFILRVGDDAQIPNRQSVQKLIELKLIEQLPRLPKSDWYSYELNTDNAS